MPGYKGHIVGGLVIYGIALYAIKQWFNPTGITEAEWLLFTLIGSLFPDIDVKSKGHNWAYSFLFLVLCILLLRGHYELVAIAGVVSLLPMIARHRGLFHRLWFIIFFAIMCAAICTYTTSISCAILMWDALFFVLGALSHLVLDLGFKRTFGVR